MSEQHTGQVISFYSYKGGVGRSMAVANVAALLAQRGKKVLVLDFDLEAPGLHRYFFEKSPHKKLGGKRYEPETPRPGVIEFFSELNKRLASSFPEGIPLQGDGEPVLDEATQSFLKNTVQEMLDSQSFGYRIHLRNPNVPTSSGSPLVASLQFLPAGRCVSGKLDGNYAENVLAFNWQTFYERYSEVFPLLAEEWGRRYDYVLIDSRTGISDIGSVCTMVLPEKLVLVFSPNRQSLDGVLEVGRQAVTERQRMTDMRPLPLFPLLSRLEDSEQQLKEDWIGRAREKFQDLFSDLYALGPCDLEEYFDVARIPHRSFYAYGESIASEEHSDVQTGSMAQAYRQFVDCLGFDNPNEVKNLKAREAEDELLGWIGDEESLKSLTERRPDELRPRALYASFLQTHGRLLEAVEQYNKIIRRFSTSQDLETRTQVAIALANKGVCLTQARIYAEGLIAYDVVIHRYAAEPEFQQIAAQVFMMRGLLHETLGRQAEALSNYDEVVRRYSNSSDRIIREQMAAALINKGVLLIQQGRHAEAIATYDEVVRRFGEATEVTLREQVARALVNKGICLSEVGQHPEALVIHDEVVRRFGEAMEVSLCEQVARALINKGVSLSHQARPMDAMAVWTEVVHRFGEAPEASLREQVALALVNKGITLDEQGQHAEAAVTCDEVVQRFGEAMEISLREQVAKALINKGVSLSHQARPMDAMAIWTEVVHRFGEAPEASLREQVALALVNKGITLDEQGQHAEAAVTYDEVVRRFGEATEVPLLEKVAVALVNKGMRLGKQALHAEEVAIYDEVVRRFGEAAEASLRQHVAMALVNKGLTLNEQGQHTEAAAIYDEAVRRFSEATEAPLREQVAKALFNKAVGMRVQGQHAEALATYDEVERRFGKATEAPLRQQVAQALVNKGVSLGEQGQHTREVATYDEVVRRFGEATEAPLRQQVAQALVNKGVSLGEQGQHTEAVATYDEVVRRFGEATEVPLRELVAQALINKGVSLGEQGQHTREVATYDEVVRRFGEATEAPLREQLAQALVNKGISLSEQGQYAEAVPPYDEVVRRFSQSTETPIRQQVICALTSAGFAYLCEAKRQIQRGAHATASSLLALANNKTAAALALDSKELIPLGNAGYIAFLQGRKDEARSILAEAIRRGGEEMRQTELEDSNIHSIPADEEFRELIRGLPTDS